MSKIEQNKTFYQLISEPLIIPDYQRDYAQGRVNDLKILETRRIFIGDIIEASTNRRQTHLGLVFGSDNNGLNGFVAVDGQQRLTTCFLFHLYISKSLSNNAESGLFERLRNFGWHGRIYASEFTDFLIKLINPYRVNCSNLRIISMFGRKIRLSTICSLYLMKFIVRWENWRDILHRRLRATLFLMNVCSTLTI